jgi:hypothetical protein
MKELSLRARSAAVAGGVLVTLGHVWLIANYAYPHAETGTLVVASHGRRADFDLPMSRVPAPTPEPWRFR